MATENKLWIPALSPKDQEKLDRVRNNQRKASNKWIGFSGKTLWDWLQLLGVLAIPIVVALASIWYSIQQSQISEVMSQKQHQTDVQIANDQQQEAALQTYLDRMSELLLDKNLGKSKPNDEVRNVARARTLTVLRRLDPIRKGLLLQFLNESGLISKDKAVVNLSDADLSGVILSYSHINPKFNGTVALGTSSDTVTLSTSSGTVTLSTSHGIQFISGSQGGTILLVVNQQVESNLSGVDLSGAKLEGASLGSVNLSGTDLSGADLRSADLSGADLSGADLSFANLKGASIGNTELMNAKSLQGAIMPDGTKHP